MYIIVNPENEASMTRIWAETALLGEGWANDVVVEVGDDGTIVKVLEDVGRDEAKAGHHVGALLPAPANLHSHAFQRAMAGLSERRGPGAHDTFWTWREIMYRFLGAFTPQAIEDVAAFVQMEMAEKQAESDKVMKRRGPRGRRYTRLNRSRLLAIHARRRLAMRACPYVGVCP